MNNIPNQKGNSAKFNHSNQNQNQPHRVASRMEGGVKNRGSRPVKKVGKGK